jgi:hypothetical protein
MGSEPVEAGSSSRYTEVFENVFPHCLTIGMSYEEFWYKDPHIIKYYLEAEKERFRRRNEEMWLQGFYIYQAIGAFSEILPAFPKKGAKIRPYLQEPVSLSEAEQQAREERKEAERIERIKQKMLARTSNK